MTSIRAVCLDLDETLLDDETSFALSVVGVRDDLGPAYPGLESDALLEVYRLVSQAYWLEVADAVMSGRLDGESVRLEGWRLALAECGYDDPAIAREALGAYTRHRAATYALFDDAIEAIEALSTRYRLAIITNGSTFTQQEKIERTGLAQYIQCVVISGEAGVAKPDAAIFQSALEALDVAPAQAVHIGDNLSSDVQGARNAGLRSAIWLNRHNATRTPTNPAPDFELHTLTELPGLLTQL